jgi:hypothetical protein
MKGKQSSETKALNANLHNLLEMDETDPRFYNVASSTAAQWMLSNPSPLFNQYYHEYKQSVLKQCQYRDDGIATASNLDVAVQLCTWCDYGYFWNQYEATKEDILQCLEGFFLFIKPLRGDKDNDKNKRCVFFTSDDDNETKYITDRLKASLWKAGMDIDFVTSNRSIQLARHFSWHTRDGNNDFKDAFDACDLQYRINLLIWMLLGDADHVIYTVGSPYGQTACMRQGYHGQKHAFSSSRSLSRLASVSAASCGAFHSKIICCSSRRRSSSS